MPEITYTPTITEDLTVSVIRYNAKKDPDQWGPAEQARIEACRKWVAENPEYPDGTIAFVETGVGSHWYAQVVEGKWISLSPFSSHNDTEIPGVRRVTRVLHLPSVGESGWEEVAGYCATHDRAFTAEGCVDADENCEIVPAFTRRRADA